MNHSILRPQVKAHLSEEQQRELVRLKSAIGEKKVAALLGTSKAGLEELGRFGAGMRKDVVDRIGAQLDELRLSRAS